MDKFFNSVGQFFTFLIAVTLMPIINGFVLQQLWIWFITPLFGYLQPTLPQTIGLMVIISFIRFKPLDEIEGESHWKRLGKSLVIVISKGLLALTIGYIVTLFL